MERRFQADVLALIREAEHDLVRQEIAIRERRNGRTARPPLRVREVVGRRMLPAVTITHGVRAAPAVTAASISETIIWRSPKSWFHPRPPVRRHFFQDEQRRRSGQRFLLATQLALDVRQARRFRTG